MMQHCHSRFTRPAPQANGAGTCRYGRPAKALCSVSTFRLHTSLTGTCRKVLTLRTATVAPGGAISMQQCALYVQVMQVCTLPLSKPRHAVSQADRCGEHAHQSGYYYTCSCLTAAHAGIMQPQNMGFHAAPRITRTSPTPPHATCPCRHVPAAAAPEPTPPATPLAPPAKSLLPVTLPCHPSLSPVPVTHPYTASSHGCVTATGNLLRKQPSLQPPTRSTVLAAAPYHRHS